MAVKKRPPVEIEEDLEATAELPAIDFTAGAETAVPVLHESAVATDIFPGPVVQVGASELADSLREVEQRLQRKAERVHQLDAELLVAQGGLAELQAKLDASAASHDELERERTALLDALAEVRAQLQSQRDVFGESQRDTEQRALTQQHQERELAALRSQSAQQLEALATWQGFRAVSEAMVAEVEEVLRGADAAREQAVGEVQSTLAGRDAELAALRAEVEALKAQEEMARKGVAVYEEQCARLEALESELADTRERLQEADELGRAMGERAHRLEVEAEASAALLGNLQQNMERLGRDDTGTSPVLKPPPPEPVVRVLIRIDGQSEVVYPIARRTTIGRTSENDIQVDTTFVSRHHAVVLSNQDHCIVEDLNSTNGVMVNGHRVGRQVLRDGDQVTVGRTEFRFQQRS